MIVFEVNKLFREIFGLQSFNQWKYGRYIQDVVPIVVTFSLFFVISTSFLNFILNFDDNIHRAWPSLAPLLGMSTFATVYWYLLMNRAVFYSLFDDMQALVNEST